MKLISLFAKCSITIFLLALFLIPTKTNGQIADDASERLDNYCKNIVGSPRVEKITDNVWIAINYDLVSTVLVRTDEGSIVIDTGMSPSRARDIRAALEKETDVDPVKVIILTHSHMDHVGGTTVWAEEDTQIWSTDAMPEHLMKQYGYFIDIEILRGSRQYAHHIPDEVFPCRALGRPVDMETTLESGVVFPTHTFSNKHIMQVGGTTIELHEAHGETQDSLFVWLPEKETLITGDQFYWSFPNLYTIRGTSPRPVSEWIASLDTIRALEPEHFVPNHTLPIHGKEEIAETLTNYRDAIQWVRDETIRRANKGEDLDTIAENVSLPAHLADLPYTGQYYGQVDWSAKAIYTNNLGWFDGRPDQLYPLPRSEVTSREIQMMGGFETVFDAAFAAYDKGDYKWAVHLLSKLKYSDFEASTMDAVNKLLANCYENLAQETYNTNGRGYLLESAYELRNGIDEHKKVKLNDELVAAVPLEHIFNLMAVRLDPEKAMDKHMTVMFEFEDEKKRFIVTIRHGIAEVVEGKPLPGTPRPVASLKTDSISYRFMALGLIEPTSLISEGKLKITGNMAKFMEFMGLFDTEL